MSNKKETVTTRATADQSPHLHVGYPLLDGSHRVAGPHLQLDVMGQGGQPGGSGERKSKQRE